MSAATSISHFEVTRLSVAIIRGLNDRISAQLVALAPAAQEGSVSSDNDRLSCHVAQTHLHALSEFVSGCADTQQVERLMHDLTPAAHEGNFVRLEETLGVIRARHIAEPQGRDGAVAIPARAALAPIL